MSWRYRKTTYIVTAIGLGVVIVICQQWILSLSQSGVNSSIKIGSARAATDRQNTVVSSQVTGQQASQTFAEITEDTKLLRSHPRKLVDEMLSKHKFSLQPDVDVSVDEGRTNNTQFVRGVHQHTISLRVAENNEEPTNIPSPNFDAAVDGSNGNETHKPFSGPIWSAVQTETYSPSLPSNKLKMMEVAVKDMDADSFAINNVDMNLDGSVFDDLPSVSKLTTSQTKVNSRSTFLSDEGRLNVVSMSLYGSNKRYTNGALQNAYLVRQNLPGWQLWIYTVSPTATLAQYETVPSDVMSQLVNQGADIHYITPQDDFIPPMMWRFLVADDPAVSRFIVRDADSRLTRRDAAAVADWIRSGQPFHCIRDHPSHSAYAISGGLWGGEAVALRSILRRSWSAMMRGYADGYLNDMNFLNNVIWTRVQPYVYCSDSVSCDKWPRSAPFPVQRRGFEHVGQVFDENGVERSIDTKILQESGENQRCMPKKVDS